MSLTLADLATHIPGAIDLFEKYELDYYQHGKQTLEHVCKECGFDFSKIDNELTQLPKSSNYHIDLEEYGIEQLIDFISNKFHCNVKEMYRTIDLHIENLLSIESYPFTLKKTLNELDQKFTLLEEKLTKHCDKEDKMLFPYIRSLVGTRRNKGFSSLEISLVKNPVRILESEHEEAATILSEIKKLLNGFKISPQAPALYNILMEELQEFEKKLHMHLHIENNILFPKLIALEEELKKKIM